MTYSQLKTPWMIAHRIDWLVMYEIVIAKAVPKLAPYLLLPLGRRIGLDYSSARSPFTAGLLKAARPPAISRICFLSIEGWAAKSKPSRSRTTGSAPSRRSFRCGARPCGRSSRSQNMESASRMVSSCRLVDKAVDLVPDRGQPEPVEHLDQVIMLHHQHPPDQPLV